ncbi:MAG: 4-amino-4-deoxychorismate lyase [Verrucomicrobia bacterium]|nr:4-amino-4-deoxychorismate lyase [Verrucomicrobiota bacterium]
MSGVAQVPVWDAGFRHGVGVFETIRVKDGRAQWRDWHLESIRESAQALGLQISEKEFGRVPPGFGLWRWFVTQTGTRSWWSEGVELPPAKYKLNLATTGVWSTSWEARYKTLSYLNRIQAKTEAEGADAEVVMLNERGELASASMANLFWVKNGLIRTPARDCGCRGGTVRRWILEKSGRRVEEGRWGMDELDGAEEIFLTNARIGIKPVGLWQGKKMPEAEVARSLAEAFWVE